MLETLNDLQRGVPINLQEINDSRRVRLAGNHMESTKVLGTKK